MNYATIPGPGDSVTWGGRCPNPSRHEGPVFFPMTIGHEGGRVTVMGRTNGYELEHIDEVLIEGGVCILKYLDVACHEDIRNHYERHAEAINKAATEPTEP